jgi:hypothetical protein
MQMTTYAAAAGGKCQLQGLARRHRAMELGQRQPGQLQAGSGSMASWA